MIKLCIYIILLIIVLYSYGKSKVKYDKMITKQALEEHEKEKANDKSRE